MSIGMLVLVASWKEEGYKTRLSGTASRSVPIGVGTGVENG